MQKSSLGNLPPLTTCIFICGFQYAFNSFMQNRSRKENMELGIIKSPDCATNASVSCGFLAVLLDQNEAALDCYRCKVKRAWAHACSLENLCVMHKRGCSVTA